MNTDPESLLPFSSQFVISDNPGLSSFTALADKINTFSDKFLVQLNQTTGKITLTVNPNYAIIFSAKLASMLSISSTNINTESLSYYPGLALTLMKFMAGTYTGAAAINLTPFKTINVMLNQINTTTNIQNGAPSRVLDTLAVSSFNFGEIVSVNHEFPYYKLLTGGLVPVLEISIADDNGKAINNNGQPITVILEIIRK